MIHENMPDGYINRGTAKSVKKALKSNQELDILWSKCEQQYKDLKKKYQIKFVMILFLCFLCLGCPLLIKPGVTVGLVSLVIAELIFYVWLYWIVCKKKFPDVSFEKFVIKAIDKKKFTEHAGDFSIGHILIIDNFGDAYNCKFKDIYNQIEKGQEYAVIVFENVIYGAEKI